MTRCTACTAARHDRHRGRVDARGGRQAATRRRRGAAAVTAPAPVEERLTIVAVAIQPRGAVTWLAGRLIDGPHRGVVMEFELPSDVMPEPRLRAGDQVQFFASYGAQVPGQLQLDLHKLVAVLRAANRRGTP